ncbi:zinc-binding domain-containing protein [Xylariaceae sp. FL0016]|nr:zinc-binding domain-containing protein [Xylariaceae sp. FL0016]
MMGFGNQNRTQSVHFLSHPQFHCPHKYATTMTRGNRAANPKAENTTFMYPSLHQDVKEAVSGDITAIPWFKSRNNKEKMSAEYDTNVMGRFRCSRGCARGNWTSKKVSIVIRSYHGNGYNAIVFNQRCRSCGQLGLFTLDEDSYVERVAYRLKKWAGVQLDRPPYTDGSGPPHKKELCEGCKHGYCQKGDGESYLSLKMAQMFL